MTCLLRHVTINRLPRQVRVVYDPSDSLTIVKQSFYYTVCLQILSENYIQIKYPAFSKTNYKIYESLNVFSHCTVYNCYVIPVVRWDANERAPYIAFPSSNSGPNLTNSNDFFQMLGRFMISLSDSNQQEYRMDSSSHGNVCMCCAILRCEDYS